MKFTLRDILWLTVVVGLVLGWWLDHRRVGLAPHHLQTLIDILASHDISVQLKPEGVRAITPSKPESFEHYQAFGAGVWRYDRGGWQGIDYSPEPPDDLVVDVTQETP